MKDAKSTRSRAQQLTLVASFPADATPAAIAKALTGAGVRRAVARTLGPAGRGDDSSTDVTVELKTKYGTIKVAVKRKKKTTPPK